MDIKHFVIEFERRLQVMFPDMIIENKPSSDLILQYINNAIMKFVTTRYTGTNFKNLGFEQDQKRTDDLKNLVETFTYSFDEYEDPSTDGVELPSNYMHLLGETVYIYSYDKCWPKLNGAPVVKNTDVIEATIENVDKKLENTLSEHRLRGSKAKPIRLLVGNKLLLFTEGNYKISKYKMFYLRFPKMINLNNPTEQYTDLSEDTQREVINIAVSAYLGDKGDQRYSISQNEIQTME